MAVIEIERPVGPVLLWHSREVGPIHHERDVRSGIPFREWNDIGPDPGAVVLIPGRQINFELSCGLKVGIGADIDFSVGTSIEDKTVVPEGLDHGAGAVHFNRAGESRESMVPMVAFPHPGLIFFMMFAEEETPFFGLFVVDAVRVFVSSADSDGACSHDRESFPWIAD